MKYEAPRVQTFGTFRDLTNVGSTGIDDVLGVGGCDGAPTQQDCIPVRIS